MIISKLLGGGCNPPPALPVATALRYNVNSDQTTTFVRPSKFSIHYRDSGDKVCNSKLESTKFDDKTLSTSIRLKEQCHVVRIFSAHANLKNYGSSFSSFPIQYGGFARRIHKLYAKICTV
jgi:hypothetical protein